MVGGGSAIDELSLSLGSSEQELRKFLAYCYHRAVSSGMEGLLPAKTITRIQEERRKAEKRGPRKMGRWSAITQPMAQAMQGQTGKESTEHTWW